MKEKKKQRKHISLTEYAEAVGISRQGAYKRLKISGKHPGIKHVETIGTSMVLHLSRNYKDFFKINENKFG